MVDWSKLTYSEIESALLSAPILAGPWKGSDGGIFVPAEWCRAQILIDNEDLALVYKVEINSITKWHWRVSIPIPDKNLESSRYWKRNYGSGAEMTREVAQNAADNCLVYYNVLLSEMQPPELPNQRKFKKIVFLGSPNSKEIISSLHSRLDEALNILGGLQQPDRCENEECAKQCASDRVHYESELSNAIIDLRVALGDKC